MSPIRRDAFTLLRESLRWRVAWILSVLISLLMVVLGSINTHLGLADTALLAWAVLAVSVACAVALWLLPRHLGGTLFFVAIALLLVGVMVFGYLNGRPMQHWAYIFPPVITFLLGSGRALVAMLVFGVYATVMTMPLIPGIDVVRFSSGYGLQVCFLYTYALLQERAAAMLSYHSDHDALSNCLNRRIFNETVEQLAGPRARARNGTFLLIDIDHFKAINDQHGHLVGDQVITATAAELLKVLAPGTPLFRYGGEEFAVLLLDASPGEGERVAERLRAALEGARFDGIGVTISIGVSEWRQGEDSIAAALDRADRALYDAKRRGRNRVVAAPPPSPA